jgi:UPF0755 protein
MRWLRALVLIFTLAGIAAGVVAADFFRFLHGPMAPAAEADDILDVQRGTSVRRIAERLTTEGWIDRPLYFRLMARYTDVATRIQAGEYRLEAGQTPYRLLRRLVEGDVIRYRFTVVEGWSFSQMRAALENHDAVRVTLVDAPDEAIMEHLDRPDEHPEGWFYPDTYSFARGTSDVEVYRQAHRRMVRVLEEEWENRDEDAPVDTPYEALILASIVERETGVAAERRRVAGVFAERLDIGMRLQTDPTVAYGLGDDYTGRLRYRDLDRDTPYNTYTRAGLTPTPIAMPGRPAIHAALNPDRRGEYYFVATGDGGHKFSRTLDEHNEAVIQYQLDGDASRLRGYQAE